MNTVESPSGDLAEQHTQRLLRDVVVIGGGTMGMGIAESFLTQMPLTPSVTIIEQDGRRAEQVRARLAERLSRRTDGSGELDRSTIAVRTVYDGVSADLVVEAVHEVMDVKRSVLARASEAWPNAVIASNTSSLSLVELARHVTDPQRFLGMHFFNPVPKSLLVELVVPPTTSPITLAAVRGWVEQLGKELIEVSDSPGFATTRLGVVVGLEAIRMVEAGVATPDDIDRGMCLGYRFPIGPLRLTDLIGLDVRLEIAEHLSSTLGQQFAVPDLLREMVADGRLGKKTGRGFFVW